MRRLLPVMLALLVLLPAVGVHAQWRDDDRVLQMPAPGGWMAMDDALLDEANRSVSPVTGRGFIAGYQANEAQTLLFPYLLVQYIDYGTLPQAHRPTHQIDEYATLQLLSRLVGPFGADDPLPAGTTAARFAQAYDKSLVRLVSLDGEGGFVIAGRIPIEGGGRPIDYHTVGRIGRAAIALATVFTNEGIESVRPIIDNILPAFAFEPGAGFDGLPERDPGVVGFLPPPAVPLPEDALRGGQGMFGFVPADGYFPMAAGGYDTSDPLLTDATPPALRSAIRFDQLLTRTPTSQRITQPFVAAGHVGWPDLRSVRVGGRLERQLTIDQWTALLSEVVGLDPAIVRLQLDALDDSGVGHPSISGQAVAAGESAWVWESVDLPRGRTTLTQRATDRGDQTLLLTRTLTLVVGTEGLAVMVSQAYADMAEADRAALESMADSMRMAGGKRLVDVPPAEAGGAGSTDTPPTAGDATPSTAEEDALITPEPDAASPGGAVSPSAASSPDPPTTSGPSTLALVLIFGTLLLVFVGIGVAVAVNSHKKAARRREKARARRERLAGDAPPRPEAPPRRHPSDRPRHRPSRPRRR